MIGFDSLRARLIEQLRFRIRNGELTERALARKAGISQPHLHNLLKGVRALNADRSDQLLARLGLSALDLFEGEELRYALLLRARQGEVFLEVPVLQDRLGPGFAWPTHPSPFERVEVPLHYVSRLAQPAVARLSDDPAMNPIVSAGDLVLLDASGEMEGSDPDTLFAVEVSGGGVALRWLRHGRGRLYLVSVACRDHPSHWELAPRSAQLISARAIPLHSMRQPGPGPDSLLPPRDILPGPGQRSGAS